MVFLDYTSVSASIDGGGTIFTASYKCLVSVEFTAQVSSPNPTSVEAGDAETRGLYVSYAGSSYRHYPVKQMYNKSPSGSREGAVYSSGGSFVMKSGQSLGDNFDMTGGSISVIIHVFRLPEAP